MVGLVPQPSQEVKLLRTSVETGPPGEGHCSGSQTEHLKAAHLILAVVEKLMTPLQFGVA